jgi:hypothetical protein
MPASALLQHGGNLQGGAPAAEATDGAGVHKRPARLIITATAGGSLTSMWPRPEAETAGMLLTLPGCSCSASLRDALGLRPNGGLRRGLVGGGENPSQHPFMASTPEGGAIGEAHNDGSRS